MIVEITSMPDRDSLVAEIWLDDAQVAEVSREESGVQIEVYPLPGGAPWKVDVDEFNRAIKAAIDRLN